MSVKEMRQTVLVGLGGTGSRVVNNVARMLRERDIAINDGKVTCVVLDTNQADNSLIQKSGTNIPVIPTCENWRIKEYFERYANMRVNEWCPYSPSFGESSMIDGAAEVRVKSRMAFMDTMESSKIQMLKNEIEKVFHNRPGRPEKIRVMLVSSLSGGTGSGMFLQVALWLRQYFESRGCLATIRGILLLPDIFISTVPNIRDNPRKPLYHYANAYAAIREMNAINKVVKDREKNKLERPMIIDGLFNSDNPPSTPVFDNTFFIDDVASSGAAFTDISTYEKMVAQVAFMQLYAPMQDEMISVEDNLYRAFEANPEPSYGSCGTARAEYPLDDVVEYCSIRAAQDAIAQGWNRLDIEIQAMKDELKQAQKDGHDLDVQIVTGDEYIRLFDEKSKRSGKEIGLGDRLFVTIKNDVNHLSRDASDPTNPVIKATCKVKKYMESVYAEIKRTVEAECDFAAITDVCVDLPDENNPKAFSRADIPMLEGLRESEEAAVAGCLDSFDKKKDKIVESIMRTLVPMDMGEVNGEKKLSVYSLFTNHNLDGGKTTVHPVAARYLLYKLMQRINKKQKELTSSEKLRELAIAGDEDISFDILKTKNRQESRENYFNELGLVISKDEIAHYIARYREYNLKNKQLCDDFARGAVMNDVLRRLAEYVGMLIAEMEDLFAGFGDISRKLADDLDVNMQRNENSVSNIMYVYAKREHKEAMYESLGMDALGENAALNESVVKALYGKFCYRNRPNAQDNQPYCDLSIGALVYKSLLTGYTSTIAAEYKNKINLNIVEAINAESDFDVAEEKMSLKQQLDGESSAATRAQRHTAALLYYKNQLMLKSAPFLRAEADWSVTDLSRSDSVNLSANNEIWMTTADGRRICMPFKTNLTFWGFHTDLAGEDCELASVLDVNECTAASEGYNRNELCCYQSIYGVVAGKIAKFNEREGGTYYVNYSAVINSMIKSGSEIETPHLDKTWHEFLPYISPEREQDARAAFGKAFWRALAYKRVTLDNHGYYQLALKEKDAYGQDSKKILPLKDEKGNAVESTDICRLVRVLRSHAAFNAQVTDQMEAEYLEDIRDKTTFKSAKIFRNLLEDEKINPFTLLAKFQRSRKYDPATKTMLLGALEATVRDLAENLDVNRTAEDSVNKSTFKQLYNLYAASDAAYKALVIEEKGWMEDYFIPYGYASRTSADAEKAQAVAEANADEEIDE